MIRENRLIKGININDEEHKIAQMIPEGDAISFEQSISTVDNFGRKSGLAMISGKRLGAGIAQWLERRTRNRKVAGLNPCRSGGRIFFSRVNFLC